MGGVNVTGLLVTEEAGGPGTAIRYPLDLCIQAKLPAMASWWAVALLPPRAQEFFFPKDLAQAP